MDKENAVNEVNLIYTIEYYIVEKNNDILNFLGKGMELENIILSEVTQTQKNNYHMYSLISVFLNIKQRKPVYKSQFQRT